jgi:hypothetical protein
VIEGARARPGLAGDLGDRDPEDAPLVEVGSRRVEQAVARAERARAEAPAGAGELRAPQIERSRPAQ